jgi:hypothetical protein
MPNIDYSECFGDSSQKAEMVNEDLIKEQDWLMEQILENINTTPIGQVLKRIASLPEVRREKILDVRQQLNKGSYNLSERLDGALDKVLEDLTT